MPIPHFRVSVVSRSGGRSAVATAAYDSGNKLSSSVASASYISGQKLYDQHAEKVFDYTRKEHVVHTEIRAPAHVPDWMRDRESLWNRVEASEVRKDAQLCRSIIAALPRELSTEENIALVRDFVDENFVKHGMVVDFAIHQKDSSDGGQNPHVHMLITMRDIEGNGFGKKNRDWNKVDRLTGWRDRWEHTTNHYLDAAGTDARVSLKSYEIQGIDKIPQVHLGYEANALEKKGKRTKVGDSNRERKAVNDNRIQTQEPKAKSTEPANTLDNDPTIQAVVQQYSAALEKANKPPERIATERSEQALTGRENVSTRQVRGRSLNQNSYPPAQRPQTPDMTQPKLDPAIARASAHTPSVYDKHAHYMATVYGKAQHSAAVQNASSSLKQPAQSRNLGQSVRDTYQRFQTWAQAKGRQARDYVKQKVQSASQTLGKWTARENSQKQQRTQQKDKGHER